MAGAGTVLQIRGGTRRERSNDETYLLIVPVTPSYLEHCAALDKAWVSARSDQNHSIPRGGSSDS